MTISFILAMDEQRGIGVDNRLPWRLPADTAFFKATTMGHPVLMGRKTYESIGKPLPGRTNIVLTRDRDYQAPGCTVVHSVEELLAFAKASDGAGNGEESEIFVIGGAEIYRLLMPVADRMYITEIAHTFPADTFFPEFGSEWQEVRRVRGVKDEANPYDYDFVVYERERTAGQV